MCQSYNYLGSRTDGGFAEYVAAPVWNLIELPTNVGFEDAAMLEPTSVALHAVRQADRTGAETAAVYGCGTIGTLILQWLSAMGIRHLYGIGTREEQRNMLTGLIDCSFCNCRAENPTDFIMKKTAGKGADLVFECVGVRESVNHVVSSVKAGGQVVLVGNPEGNMTFDQQVYWKILRRQLTMYGTWNSSFTGEKEDDWHTSIKAIQEGKIRPSGQITHRFPFEMLQAGLSAMQDRDIFTNKVMIGKPVT